MMRLQREDFIKINIINKTIHNEWRIVQNFELLIKHEESKYMADIKIEICSKPTTAKDLKSAFDKETGATAGQ